MRDLTGERFGRLVVLEASLERPRHWVCRCDCGGEWKHVYGYNLTGGKTRSCGCWRRELAGHRADMARRGEGSF